MEANMENRTWGLPDLFLQCSKSCIQETSFGLSLCIPEQLIFEKGQFFIVCRRPIECNLLPSKCQHKPQSFVSTKNLPPNTNITGLPLGAVHTPSWRTTNLSSDWFSLWMEITACPFLFTAWSYNLIPISLSISSGPSLLEWLDAWKLWSCGKSSPLLGTWFVLPLSSPRVIMTKSEVVISWRSYRRG